MITYIQQFQNDLAIGLLFDWTLDNHLSFNISKFVLMSFHCIVNWSTPSMDTQYPNQPAVKIWALSSLTCYPGGNTMR